MVEPVTDGSAFKEINALRHTSLKESEEEEYTKDRAKLNDTIFATIVDNHNMIGKAQEISTLGVIVLNALFIGYDTDYSARWGSHAGLYKPGTPWGFPFMENFFCVYFTLEVWVRYMAFRDRMFALFDAWFVFDSCLVALMILETWVLEFIDGDGIPIDMDLLRLLRLLRITRMTKLLRFFPELAIIVKGMVAAVRSVLCTAFLLVLVLYVFSIIFTDAYHAGRCEGEGDDVEPASPGTRPCNDDDLAAIGGAQELFGSIGRSMRHLFIMGTILDDMTACTNSIRSSKKANLMMVFFVIFVLVSSFTMLNMLIGILCEVVTATSEGERTKAQEDQVRTAIGNLFKQLDEDGNGTISRKEFLSMKDDKSVKDALAELDVNTKHFDMYAELLFTPPEDGAPIPSMNIDNTINMIMRLRPGSKVSALDFASFQQGVFLNHSTMKHHINRIDKMMSRVIDYDPAVDDPDNPISPESEAQEVEEQKDVTVDDLDIFSVDEIRAELQKRIGMDVELPTNLDPSLNVEAMVEAFETLCVPQTETDVEAWSKETYTC